MNDLTDAESAVIDFPGWLGKLPEDRRGRITEYINRVPEPERAQEQDRFAAMLAVSESTGLDPREVSDNWELRRGGYAEQQEAIFQDGRWAAVKDDESGFIARIKEQAIAKDDELRIISGSQDPKDVKSWEESLIHKTDEAAYAGKPYADALSDWEATHSKRPGYGQRPIWQYADLAANRHKERTELLAKVRPIAEQAVAEISAFRKEDGGDMAPFALLRGLSVEEKDLAIRVMTDLANSAKADPKSKGQAIREAVGRSFENLFLGGGNAELQSALLTAKYKAGDKVTTSDPVTEVLADLRSERRAEDFAGDIGRQVAVMGGRALTAEEAESWNGKVAEAIEDLETLEQLRKFGQNVVDPAARPDHSKWWYQDLFARGVIPAAESTAIITTMSIPGGWAPAMRQGAAMYRGEAYAQYRAQGMEREEADALAGIEGAAKAALDKLQVGILAKGVPGLNRVLERFAMRGGVVARYGVNVAGTVAAETVIELTQDHIIPALVQDNFASNPVFDVEWGKVWTLAAEAAPQTALGMVILSALGGIGQTSNQSRFVKEFSSSGSAMRARGYTLEQIEEIQAAPDAQKGELLAAYLPVKAPDDAGKAIIAKDVKQLAAKEQAAFDAVAAAELTATQEAAEIGVRVTKKGNEWQVTTGTGKVLTVDTVEAARVIREDLKQAATQEEADAFVAAIDRWTGKTADNNEREVSVTGDTVASQGGTVTRQRGVELIPETMSEQGLNELWSEAERQAADKETFIVVNGSNTLEAREKVGRGVRQVLEINRSDVGGLMTFLHESIESDYRLGLKSGAFNAKQVQSAIGALAPSFARAAARNQAVVGIASQVQKIADGLASETEIRETLSELAVADILGRNKEGGIIPAGSVSAALNSAITEGANDEATKGISKIKAFFWSLRRYFRALVGTVSALRKAKRDGTAQEFDALLNELLGLEQTEHESGVVEDLAAVADEASLTYVPPTAEEEAAGIAFSVSARRVLPGNYPESLATVVTSTRVSKLTSHPQYDAAKRNGDGEAALSVVRDNLKPSAIEGLKKLIAGRDVIFTAVKHRDTGTRINAIPLAYADELAAVLGGSVDEGIVKTSGRANTGATVEDRFANVQSFEGPVEAGRVYVIVDDNHTSGDTLAALVDHIEAGGGEVIAATTLAVSQSGPYLKPRAQDVAKLLDLTGLTADTFTREIGVSINALTGSEIFRLANLGPRGWEAGRFREYVRSRISPGGDAAGSGGSAGGAGETFAVTTGSRLELVMKRLDSALKGDPARRRVLAREANHKLQALAFNWEQERWTGQGDRIRPIIDQQDARSLAREVRIREAFRREELEAAVYTKYADVFGNADLASIWSGPVMSALSKPGTRLNGRLKSKSAAMQSEWFTDKTGDFDGMDGVPRVVFGGSLMPDQAAQELFDEGLIKEPSVDALWAAIKQEADQAARWKEFLKVANAELKQAKEQARKEVAAWKEEREAMMLKDWNPRARLLRDMRTLDAILSVMPADIRGKVGGFLKLATLSSDKARADEIGRRIEKLGELVEAHLKEETTTAMSSLLEKAAPDREAGKQSRGKLGAEVHRYFDSVASAYAMDEAEVKVEKSKIRDARFDEAGNEIALTDEQELDLWEREQVLDTFGAWDKKTAADMDAAFLAASEVYREGRNRWRMTEEIRLGELKALAEEAVATLGGPSYAGAQKQKLGGKVRALKKLGLDLKSFAEVLEAAFGVNHPLVKRWARAAREGFAQRNDTVRALRKRWKEAVESATRLEGVKARRALYDMAHDQTINAPNAGAANTSTLDVPIAVVDAWASGTADPAALGITEAEADFLKDERSLMEPDDRKQSLTLRRKARDTGETVPMTQAEGIFLTMLAGQEQYADALDRAGFDAAAIESVEGQLTESAKRMREFMRTEYREGYAPLAAVFERMYGVSLPQIKNYAPAAFYHVGAERETDPGEKGGAPSAMRAGFLANRRRHTAAPRLENAFATFLGHSAQTAHWKSLAEFTREFSGVIGKPDVKRAIESAHGPEMLKTLNQWVKNIEGNGLDVQAGLFDKGVNWLSSVQAYIALAFRLGTLAKQSTALLGSAYRMPMRDYARGFARLMSGDLDVRTIYLSPVIQRRLETGFAPEVRAALDDAWLAKPTLRAAALEKGMELIGATDAFFTTGSAAIAYDYHLRKAQEAGLTGEAAEQAAMVEVEDIVSRTAQPADVVNRSLFEARLGAMGRLLFMFASEARQKSSLWLTAWSRTFTGKATKDDLRVLAISHLIVAPLLQTITAAWRDMRDDDDDEIFDAENWDPMDYAKAIVAGPLSGIPLVGEALSGFPDNGIFGRQLFAVKSLSQLLDGPQDREAEKAEWYADRIFRVMQGVDAFTGVAGSVLDQATSIVDNFVPDTQGEAEKKQRARSRRLAKEAREDAED